MNMLKRVMVKEHEKLVTASYPQLIKRGVTVNAVGTVTCYLVGLALWKLHNKLFAVKPEGSIEFKDEN